MVLSLISQSAYHLLECTILSLDSVESPLLWLRADPEMEYLAEIHFHQPVQMWVRLNFVIHNIFIGRLHVFLFIISGLSRCFCGVLGEFYYSKYLLQFVFCYQINQLEKDKDVIAQAQAITTLEMLPQPSFSVVNALNNFLRDPKVISLFWDRFLFCYVLNLQWIVSS